MKKLPLLVLALVLLPILSLVTWQVMGIRSVKTSGKSVPNSDLHTATRSSGRLVNQEKIEKDQVHLPAPVFVPLIDRSESTTAEQCIVEPKKQNSKDSKDLQIEPVQETFAKHINAEDPFVPSASNAALNPSPEHNAAKEQAHNKNLVPIAVIDPERLLASSPLRPSQPSDLYDGKGTFKKDDERLRFDCRNDYVALMDNLSLGGGDNITMSFEVEFDQAKKTDIPPDLTVFWGANPNAEYHGPIKGSWSGYELKLGGPGRNTLAHKLGGHDLNERAALKNEFKNNVPYNVEIEKKNGKLTLKIDGQTVYEAPATGNELSAVGERKGFGLVFWHTAGWIGPIRIKSNG